MDLAGVSNGMRMAGMHAAKVAHIPQESISRGATLLHTNRQVATALGVSIATVVLTAGGANRDYTSQPYPLAYLITAVSAGCAALAGVVIPRRLKQGTAEEPLVAIATPEPDA